MRLHGPRRACSTCERVMRLDAKHGVCPPCRRAAGERGQSPESRAAYIAQYTEDHAPEARARAKAWRLAHPVQNAATHRRNQAIRRARKLGQFAEHVDPAVVWERDGGVCHICKLAADPDDWHLEHVVPLARGGEHSYANTAVSHPNCNLRKGVS